MQDVIQRLRELRQSSQSSVVTGIETSANPDRPTVPHPVESWLIDLVLEQLTNPAGSELSLIVLSGNSGDGKSYLLREIRERLHHEQGLDPKLVTWLLDATESEHQTQRAVDRLDAFFGSFADDHDWSGAGLHVVAMNTGTAVRFMANDHERGRFTQLCDILSLQLAIRSKPETQLPSSEYWRRFDRVLVIDLDRRLLFPLNVGDESFLDRMLSTLDRTNPSSFLSSASNTCANCPVSERCPVNANLTALQFGRVRERLNTLLRDITLEDRIHLGPRSLWHLVYQMTVGGLDAGAVRAQRALPTCADIGTVSDEERAKALFFSSLFDAPQEGADAGSAALSAELARIDPARRFTIETHEAALAAALSKAEDLRLCRPLAQDLGLPPETIAGPAADSAARATGAVRRDFFLAPNDPDPNHHGWLREWSQALLDHRAAILAARATRHNSAALLVSVLVDLHQATHGPGLWHLSLPWRNLAELFGQFTLRPGPRQRAIDPRVLGSDVYRPEGLRRATLELAERLGAYPLSITVPLRDGPEVRVTWPLYRLLRRVHEQQYVAGSLDPERVQNLERIGASIGAQAAIRGGVVVLKEGRGLVCEDDGAGGYDVVDL